MADSKLDALTNDAAPLSTDLVYVEHDPTGTPADRKVTLANLAGSDAFTGTFVSQAAYDALTTAYVGLSYVNGWANSGLGSEDGKYCRVGGVVHLVGDLYAGSASASTVATLPAGFRPAGELTFPVVCYDPGSSHFVLGLGRITSAGVFSITVASTEGTPTHRCCFTVSFRAEA